MMDESNTITYLEFYSGIGGWSCALKEAIERINNQSNRIQCQGEGQLGRQHDDTPCTTTTSTDQNQTGSNSHVRQHNSCENDHPMLSMRCLGVFDHSDLCNKVLQHNFPESRNGLGQIGKKKRKRRKNSSASAVDDNINGDSNSQSITNTNTNTNTNTTTTRTKSIAIESLTRKQLEHTNAIIWMMSPPCQPHTRQHTNQKEDMNDPRSKSFIHLCEMISTMSEETLPRIILLENVVGFENSNSCKGWRKALQLRKYKVAHFHLTPTQLGIPNDRPRHYSIAILHSASNHIAKLRAQSKLSDKIKQWFISKIDPIDSNDPQSNALESPPCVHTSIFTTDSDSGDDKVVEIIPLSNYVTSSQNDGEIDADKSLLVPEKLLKSNSSWCFDIVTPSDQRSACFTSSYGKFVRGTGSVLYADRDITSEEAELLKLQAPEERQFDGRWAETIGPMLHGKLRYFSGIEIARIFGFPVAPKGSDGWSFSFPPDCTMKQQWKLLGNSINVHVAAKLCEVAICTLLNSS